MGTEVTGLSNSMRPFGIVLIGPLRIIFVVKEPGIVGAGNHAIAATDTAMMVHNDDPICALVGSLHGTNLGTGGIIAVVTEHRNLLLLMVLSTSLSDPHLPDPVNVPAFVSKEGHIVLISAGVHASRTLGLTLVEIDHHSPFML
jgi:hypothetical protein